MSALIEEELLFRPNLRSTTPTKPRKASPSKVKPVVKRQEESESEETSREKDSDDEEVKQGDRNPPKHATKNSKSPSPVKKQVSDRDMEH